MRIKLIVSGAMERRALHRSLQRYFPHTAGGHPVEFLQPSMFQGPTSNPLPPEGQLPPLVRSFCHAMIMETLVGSEPDRRLPDLVVGVDDLELDNVDDPHRVTRWIRRGVEHYLEQNEVNARTDQRRRERLRRHCSFHLLVPMPEAYFFGERGALDRTGVASDVHPMLADGDLESFETIDPDYPRRQGHLDEHHPKRYLKHLLVRSGRPVERPYVETRHGSAGLAELAWPTLTDDHEALAFARSLFEDIADVLEVDNPMGPGVLAPATHPTDHRALLLRNL